MMRAIGKGADGIVIAAWYQGECDYETGNLVAERNANYTKEILKTVGVSPERIQMFNCSAAEGQRFQEEITRISETIKNLGSNPLKDSIASKKEEKESKKKKTE